MAIYKRGRVWWMDVYCGDGRHIRKSCGTDDRVKARMVEQSAIALHKGITDRQRTLAIIDAVMPEQSRGLKIGDALQFYQVAMDKTLSKNERSFRVSQLDMAMVWMKDHTRVKFVSEITPEVAWQYSMHLGTLKITANTRNKRIGALGCAWKEFIRFGKATENPWSAARAKRNASEETHGRAFTDGELKRILEEARNVGHEWEGVIKVGMYTGLRMRDVETLEWGEIDLMKRMIVIEPSKTRNHHIVVRMPMHEEVYKVVREAWRTREAGETHVFPWRAGHPTKNKTEGTDCHFMDLLRRAGIEAGEGELVTFHSLRHTFVTRLAVAGVAEDVRMKLAGHTHADTHLLYTHNDEGAREAIERL